MQSAWACSKNRNTRLAGDDTKYKPVFLYLCNGINVADFVKLRYRDIVNGEICFVRQKTESTSRTLRDIQAVLTPPMQTIIDRWGQTPYPDAFIFPILTGKEDAITRKNKTKYTRT